MLVCIWNPPDLIRKPPSTSCEVWVFRAKLPEIGRKKGGGPKAGPDETLSSTVGVRKARAARPNTENALLRRCSAPTCNAYCVSLLSSGKACAPQFWNESQEGAMSSYRSLALRRIF